MTRGLENQQIETLAGFDFTGAIRRLSLDMCQRLPELAHIDMAQVAVSFCQTRKNVSHGLQASLTPLRFEDGARTGSRHGRRYSCQGVYDASGREFLYILSFYLPRFMNHPVEEKISTLLHELWHISPKFDGDLRRHEGRCFVHGSSQKEYDAQMDNLAQEWLAHDPPHSIYEFLEYNFAELAEKYGGVYGNRISMPRLVPLENAS